MVWMTRSSQECLQGWIRKGEYFIMQRKLEQETAWIFYRCDCTMSQWDESTRIRSWRITIVADAVRRQILHRISVPCHPGEIRKILRCIHDTDGLVVQKKVGGSEGGV